MTGDAHALRAQSQAVFLKAAVDRRLDALLPATTAGPVRLIEAMRYSLLSPAKRARGVLTCLAARQFGCDPARAETFAAAIEMVHAASLILDDLPCMDDAELRRGRPACHRVYGEDTSTLAAIALMSRAFECVSADDGCPRDVRAGLAARLATAIGPLGLTGGQEQDLREASEVQTLADVERIHLRKTGVLFGLAAEGGATIAGAAEPTVVHMRAFGDILGTAFQTYDDVLDGHSTIEIAGKDVSQDGSKVTIVGLLGVARARTHADARIAEALGHLEAAGGDIAPTVTFVRGLIAHLAARVPRISGG